MHSFLDDPLLPALREAESRLEALPQRPARSPEQQAQAERAIADARALRRRWLARHAEALYEQLTESGRYRLNLDALVYAAAEAVPGLVPTRAQIETERDFLQAEKDGREIDQGMFFAALLASPRCGPHLIDSMRQPCSRAAAHLDEFRRTGRLRLDRLALERRGTCAHLTVHNEDCLNAEDETLIADMEVAVDLVLLDDAVHVGVLRGAVMSHPKYVGRRVFSAGINLRELHRGRIPYVNFLLQREMGYIHKMLRGLRIEGEAGPRVLEKPWVAAVDGFAIGGGAQILLACDYVVARDDAFFSLPAAQEGIVPGVANLRLSRWTGMRLARQIVLGGRRVHAHEPEGRLLFDELADAAGMDAAIEVAAARLDAPAVVPNRRMLTLAEEPPEAFRAYLAAFAEVQAERLYAPDVLNKVARA